MPLLVGLRQSEQNHLLSKSTMKSRYFVPLQQVVHALHPGSRAIVPIPCHVDNAYERLHWQPCHWRVRLPRKCNHHHKLPPCCRGQGGVRAVRRPIDEIVGRYVKDKPVPNSFGHRLFHPHTPYHEVHSRSHHRLRAEEVELFCATVACRRQCWWVRRCRHRIAFCRLELQVW